MKNKRYDLLAICGMDAVKAVEKNNPEKIYRLYFNQERAALFGGLCKKLAQLKIPYNCVQNDDELEKLCGTNHHQGVVALIKNAVVLPINQSAIELWLSKHEHVMYLDQVNNANNVGAIIRSAAFFGIHHIVLPSEQAIFTTSAYRIAQGGMEFVQFYTVSSIVSLMNELEHKMIKIGCDTHTSVTTKDLPKLIAGKPVFFVLGNEENGISPEVKSLCNHLIKIAGFIPSGKSQTLIESLNVAQAASIFCYELSKLKTC